MVSEPSQGAPGPAPSEDDDFGPARGESPLSVAAANDLYEDHPELFVGAAFVGGFAIAQILKRLGP
ncbi:MAG TPA: hypothetical protein VHG69_09210 [Thermoleophilaceae bacterium]|nr:hypothetical protein [Thermoleophilaceae bacterium]